MIFEKPWGNYLLEAIVETKAPDTVTFWPQTIAWQLIFGLLIILIIKKSYQSWKNYKANAYRREALLWLSRCSLSNEQDIRQLPTLIRKVALIANQRLINKNPNVTYNSDDINAIDNKKCLIEHRQEITNMSGQSWVKWLDKHCSKSSFSDKPDSLNASSYSCEKLLTQLAYVPKLDISDTQLNEGLIELTKQIEIWITYHELKHDLSTQLSTDLNHKPDQAISGEST